LTDQTIEKKAKRVRPRIGRDKESGGKGTYWEGKKDEEKDQKAKGRREFEE
jgi:hypothetical protein